MFGRTVYACLHVSLLTRATWEQCIIGHKSILEKMKTYLSHRELVNECSLAKAVSPDYPRFCVCVRVHAHYSFVLFVKFLSLDSNTLLKLVKLKILSNIFFSILITQSEI